jgi:hypothetical protein
VLFHRRFLEVKITASHLANIYKTNKVKRKVVTLVKIQPPHKQKQAESKFMMMISEVREVLEQGRRLIFVDEAMFTTASRLTHAYSANKTNITVSEVAVNSVALAVVAGVSAESGLETFLVRPKSINSQSFIAFLE